MSPAAQTASHDTASPETCRRCQGLAQQPTCAQRSAADEQKPAHGSCNGIFRDAAALLICTYQSLHLAAIKVRQSN